MSDMNDASRSLMEQARRMQTPAPSATPAPKKRAASKKRAAKSLDSDD